MTKTRKLSTFFLSTVIASIIVPQVALGEKSAQDYFQQARTHIQQKELEQALEDLNQAINLNSDYTKAYNGRGFIYLKQGKLAKALQDFNQAIHLNPNYAEAYYFRGVIYRKQRDRDKAIQNLEKASTLFQEQGKTNNYQRVQQLLNKLR